jgi:hypothetical protein
VSRRGDHAEDRLAVDEERDRDAPVGMAREEGARSINRVDDPDAPGIETSGVVRRLLGEPSGRGQGRAELDLEEGIDRDIGFGHRRSAVLRPDPRGGLSPALEVAAGDPSRLARRLADGRHERKGGIGCEVHGDGAPLRRVQRALDRFRLAVDDPDIGEECRIGMVRACSTPRCRARLMR